MILDLWKNKICISIFMFILWLYPLYLGLKYCIFTGIFVGKLFHFIHPSFFTFFIFMPTIQQQLFKKSSINPKIKNSGLMEG